MKNESLNNNFQILLNTENDTRFTPLLNLNTNY